MWLNKCVLVIHLPFCLSNTYYHQLAVLFHNFCTSLMGRNNLLRKGTCKLHPEFIVLRLNRMNNLQRKNLQSPYNHTGRKRGNFSPLQSHSVKLQFSSNDKLQFNDNELCSYYQAISNQSNICKNLSSLHTVTLSQTILACSKIGTNGLWSII